MSARSVQRLLTMFLTALLLYASHLAWAADDRCCLPAIWAPPVVPAGAECKWQNNECAVDGCVGDAWAVAAPGACIRMENRSCVDNAQTLVTIANGLFDCDGGESDCACIWFERRPLQTGTVQISTCLGNDCN